MDTFSYSYFSGMGTTVLPGQVQKNPKPTAEVVPVTASVMPGWNFALPRIPETDVEALTPRRIAMMLTDPAVSSSYNTHKMNVLAGGLRLASPVSQPAWLKRPEAAQGRKLTRDQKTGKEVLAFCERCWARLRFTRGATLWQLLDAMKDRSKLAEITYCVPEKGKDKGKYVFDCISVKPNWAWRYVVDNKMKIKGFLTYAPNGNYIVYPPDKFIWISWMPADSDPRGNTIFEAAESAFNFKVQMFPQLYRHLDRFGSPGLDFEMSESDAKGDQKKPSIDQYGNPRNDNTKMDVAHYYATLLGVFRSGGVFVHGSGSTLKIAEPMASGESFYKSIDLMNREIKLAIEYQTRASLEAQHGSKADSATAENIKDVSTGYGREWLADCLYRAFWRLVDLNYGADVADGCTPFPTFGGAETANRGQLWQAAASVGYKIGESQLEGLDDELGLPIRDLEADKMASQNAVVQQAQILQNMKGNTNSDPSGPPDDPNNPDNTPGRGKNPPPIPPKPGKSAKKPPFNAKPPQKGDDT